MIQEVLQVDKWRCIVSTTVGDLTNGKVYALRRVDQNMREMDFVEDAAAVDVEFVEIANAATLTGAQINSECAALKAIAFGRVEDVDYRKDGSRSGGIF